MGQNKGSFRIIDELHDTKETKKNVGVRDVTGSEGMRGREGGRVDGEDERVCGPHSDFN